MCLMWQTSTFSGSSSRDEQCAPLPVLRRELRLGPAALAVHQFDGFDKAGAQYTRTRCFPDIARKPGCIADDAQDLIAVGEVHGPEQADLRLHLFQGKAECHRYGVEGAADLAIGPVGEEAEAVLVRIDGKQPGFLFLEDVVVSTRS